MKNPIEFYLQRYICGGFDIKITQAQTTITRHDLNLVLVGEEHVNFMEILDAYFVGSGGANLTAALLYAIDVFQIKYR